MTFLNFSQLRKVFSAQNKRKHFPENQTKFSFDWKMFFID
jgi:hypothetical protein